MRINVHTLVHHGRHIPYLECSQAEEEEAVLYCSLNLEQATPSPCRKMQRQLSLSAMPRLYQEEEDSDDLEAKPEKAPAARPSAKERSVHLIPLLTVLCFVLLFLFSHDPSASEMSSFGGKVGNRKHRLF